MVDGADAACRADTVADRIVFLGHATLLVEVEGVRLLTDPLLRGGVAHLRRQTPVVDASVFAEPDAVLISHMHHDHLDLASLRMLGQNTRLIVPAGAGAWLRKRGFSTVTELSLGEATRVGALRVGAVEARHDGRRPGGPSAETLGYLISGRLTVYFAGDTELFADMSKISPSPDVALLPVAGWGPTLGPGHMDPLDAARAVAAIQPRLAIPMHWGTLLPVGLSRRYRARLAEPPRLFAEHAARLAPSVEVRILTPGESIAVDC
jgi:L-ascorbate metabolism protein UlaG (beta-lactamase superfamily)